MKQWALDMDEPASNVDRSEQEQQGAEEPDILQQAAALEEQGSNADETAASQQGSQETSDSFQETGQYERLTIKMTCMVSIYDELPVTSQWLRGCQATSDSFQETGQHRRVRKQPAWLACMMSRLMVEGLPAVPIEAWQDLPGVCMRHSVHRLWHCIVCKHDGQICTAFYRLCLL